MKTRTFKGATATIALSLLLIAGTKASDLSKEKEALASYWVVENNIKDKSYTTVKFYNSNDEVVMERKIDGKFLKVNKRDIKRLNKELATFNSDLIQE